MRHDGAIAGLVGHFDGFQGLGQGADLVDLDQDGVGQAALDAFGQPLGVGHEQIVADQLDLAAQRVGQQLPAFEIILGHAVLDRDDRIALDQLGVVFDHALGIQGLLLAGQHIFAVLEEFGRGAVQRQGDFLARLVAGILDRLHHEVERLVGAFQRRREAAFIADIGVVAGGLQSRLQRMEHFGAHANGVGDRRRRHRHDHEFLDVDRIVGMRAAIDDVHHRHRQNMRIGVADIAPQRHAGLFGGGLGDGERHAEDGVGAQAAFVLGAVQFDHGTVEDQLFLGIHARQRVIDLAIDGLDGLQHALAAVTALVAVAQFDSLMRAGRGARGDGGAAETARLQDDIHLDGGIAARIENFAGVDVGNRGHGNSLLDLWGAGLV